MTVTTLLQGGLYSSEQSSVAGCVTLPLSKLVNSSSSALHLHLSGLLVAGAGWWAARVIRMGEKNF